MYNRANKVGIFILGVIGFSLVLTGCAGTKAYKAGGEYVVQKDWDKAYEEFLKAYSENPKSKKIKKDLEEARKKAFDLHFFAASYEHIEQRLLISAIQHLNRAIEIDPSQDKAKDLLSELQPQKEEAENLYKSALQDISAKNFNMAAEKLKESIQLCADHDDAIQLLKQATKEGIDFHTSEGKEAYSKDDWAEAIRHFEQLLELEPDSKITTLKEKASIQFKVQQLLDEADNLVEKKRYEEALNLAERALEIVANHKKARSLISLCKENIALQHLQKGKDYARGRNWEQALKEYEAVKLFDQNYKNVNKLISDAKLELAKLHYNNGINLMNSRKWSESAIEFQKALNYKPRFKDSNKQIKKVKGKWADEVYNEAVAHEKENDHGNALLKYIAVHILNPDSKETKIKISEMKDKLKERVTFRVAIFGFKNYSNNPELSGRLIDGIFEFLFKNFLDTLRIVDRSSEDMVRLESKLSGAELADLEPIEAFIDGSIYSLKIETKQEIARESVKVEVGKVKVPNPRRAEILARMNAIGATIPEFQRQYSAQSNQTLVRGYSALESFKNPYPSSLDGFNIISGLLSLSQQSSASSNISQARRKYERLQKELALTPEFLEDTQYANVEAGGDNYIKTAYLRCYLKIRDFSTRQPIFTQEVEEMSVAVDLFVKGNEEYGIKQDPLELPSDMEMEATVLVDLVAKSGEILYNQLTDYGLGYFQIANQAIATNNNFIAIERHSDFLSSSTADFYPEIAMNSLDYLETELQRIIPEETDMNVEFIKSVFPITTREKIMFQRNDVKKTEIRGKDHHQPMVNRGIPSVKEMIKWQEIKVDGIVWGQEPLAIVNGEVVKEGDNLGPFKLKEIKQESIILLRGKKEYEYKVEMEEESPYSF